MRLFKLMLFSVVLLWPRVVCGQSTYLQNQCTNLMTASGAALENRDWQRLIDLSQDYLERCSEISDKKLQTAMLDSIGIGFIEQGKYDDAVPVLYRCVSLDKDASTCWYNFGRAAVSLGRRKAAKNCWRKVIEIGSYDRDSAAAVKLAKQDLDSLEAMEKSLAGKHQLPPDPDDPQPTSPPSDSPVDSSAERFGTGFFITTDGYLLTNNHVVEGCRSLATVPDKKPLEVIARNPKPDLALLKTNYAPTSVAVFRIGPAPRLGDSVVAFGFPLPGLLSSAGNLSTGILSATSGVQDDIRFIQISAPVQPGNSGGPLFDSSGHVIGVVVAKLDAIQVARATGDVPQNVNFAVHWSEVRAFLDEQGIQYRKAPSQKKLETSDIAANAARVAIEIECSQ